MKKDKKMGGALSYALTALLTVSVMSALLAVAGFFVYMPYVLAASAAVVTPLVSILLFKLFSSHSSMDLMIGRIATGAVSLVGAYIYICFMTGVVSGVYGAYPVGMEDIRAVTMEEYIEKLPDIFGNALYYLIRPWHLWQDLVGRGDPIWGGFAAVAVFAQIGLPQLFLRAEKRSPETSAPVEGNKPVQRKG